MVGPGRLPNRRTGDRKVWDRPRASYTSTIPACVRNSRRRDHLKSPLRHLRSKHLGARRRAKYEANGKAKHNRQRRNKRQTARKRQREKQKTKCRKAKGCTEEEPQEGYWQKAASGKRLPGTGKWQGKATGKRQGNMRGKKLLRRGTRNTGSRS